MRQQADYLLATGFVSERQMEQHAVEPYGLAQLDRFHRTDPVTVNSKGYAYTLLENRQAEIMPTAELDAISSQQHSPQRTSSSVVTNHTVSCKSTPSALRSSSINGNTPVSTLNKRTANDMGEKTQVLNCKQASATAINSLTSAFKQRHNSDPKALRRLAQNREAAKKSRMRKKAYVKQLEASRAKLNQVEQELGKVRQQVGGFSGLGVAVYNGLLESGAAQTFNLEYAHWLDEKHRQTADLRAALQANFSDRDLEIVLENFMSHFNKVFQLKTKAVKGDVFHLLSGMWKTPAERCFMWMGGFRPSQILKILIPQIEPLSEQQILGFFNLQQSSQQAEDALSQGMESLLQSLAETLTYNLSSSRNCNIATYMNQMAAAMGKIGTLESFVRQADNLRQQTLQQMQRLLTVKQMVLCLLVMGEYCNSLRTLSSLWSARPKEC